MASVSNSLILWIWITDGNVYLFVLLVVVFQTPAYLFLAIGLLIHATQIPCFLTIISPQKQIVLNSQLLPTSPVCGLSFQTQSGIILFYIASHLLKNTSKVNSLKWAMLSWSWTPNFKLFFMSSANVYLWWTFQHACFVCGWVGLVGGFVVLGWWFLQHVENDILGCTVVGIILSYYCAILIYVLCACLSELEESHFLGDSDFLLLALPG